MAGMNSTTLITTLNLNFKKTPTKRQRFSNLKKVRSNCMPTTRNPLYKEKTYQVTNKQ